MRPVAVVKSVRMPSSHALRPRATARWVLPTPGGPRSRTFSPLSMKRPVGQLLDTFGVDRGLEFEVEALEGLVEGEAGHRDRIAKCFSAFERISSAEEFVEEVGVAELALGRLLEERRQLGLDAVEPEAMAVRHGGVGAGGVLMRHLPERLARRPRRPRGRGPSRRRAGRIAPGSQRGGAGGVRAGRSRGRSSPA